MAGSSRTDGRIAKMVEYKDGRQEERACRLCNSGLMAVRAHDLFALLDAGRQRQCRGRILSARHRQPRRRRRRPCAVVETDARRGRRHQQPRRTGRGRSRAGRRRRRAEAMDDGATLIAPETVLFAHDTELGRDVVIEPNVVFGPGVTVARRRRSSTPSAISRARRSAAGARSAPMRGCGPARCSAEKAKVGNFVEIKKATLGQGRQGQPPHLYRRCRGGRGRQYRRGHDHLQL